MVYATELGIRMGDDNDDDLKREAGSGPGNGNAEKGSGSGKSWRPGDPDRRHSTRKQREEYARSHDINVSGNGNGGDEKPWRHFIPKSVLWALLSLTLAIGGWFAKQWTDTQLQWKSDVNDHMRDSTAGYQRLANLEHEVTGLKAEFRDDRIDRLEERIWNAERHNDEEAVRYYKNQLRRLQAAISNPGK